MSGLIDPQTIANAGTEHAEQSALFHWAAINAQRDPRLARMFAIPNGGLRSKRTASRLKAEGAKAGVLDIFLPVPVGPYHGFFIEMKLSKYENHKNGGCSDEQVDWYTYFQSQNYFCKICYSWLDAANAICNYLQADFDSIESRNFNP